MAEELVSEILEQVRAIKADESVRDFVDVTEFQGEMDSLVLRLEAIRSKMNALKDWPLSVQLSRLEIDGYVLDDLLYDIEDMFSDFNNQLMRSRLLVEAVETKVSKEKTDPSDPDIIDLDNDPFESSISKLEVELMDLRSKLSPGPESILLDLEVSKLLGIDQVKKDIMDVILGESSKERSDKIKTISIVGMDGMGKSSLAQCICEDEQVVASFDNIILVNVSDDFDLGKIGRAIIQALEGLKHDLLCVLTLFSLQVETKSTYIFHLKELPDELCWMILREVAFNRLNEDSHECVEDIGLEIAKKCKGSPFAAKVLGGILQHKIEKREWNSVLENYIWESPMIPKNGGLHTWKMHNIVHDFLRFLFQSELMMEIQSVEHMMLDLTSSRTSKEVKSIKRVIPDSAPAPKQMKTLSDSGTSILASSCDPPLILNSSCPPLPSDFPLISIRHLTVMIAQGVGFPVDISGAEKLRTLVAVSQGCLITSRALSNLCKQSKHLSSLTNLPDGIGKLMRLRYLYTWYCCSITFYPKGIGCLTSLRELTNAIVRLDQNDAKEFSLGDFEELNHLCGDVRVKLVGNAIDADEAIRANLSNKKSLSNI
ncbi:hypothetical protein F3Y22_tig00009009pilonHSYRG00339 [Hibiscus syriacus]|uniref:NB-ARC domain-containing protein n=1 Tax=Hibiscus syriacus TaxID=106335 RepID=A0A6A3C929_HIBSY|nr:hypothetical protein F3Y22_tig00009009pilonHSYRG00339 [Hibiscus syriacus]